ncbi:MAG: DNA polymerase domain-containing protein [Nitrosopumilaceae archaeon]
MKTGWLFDVYPLHDRIILWIKNKKTFRIEKEWTPFLYVASSKHKLDALLKNQRILEFVKYIEWVDRIEKVSDLNTSKVLKLTVKDSSYLVRLAKTIEGVDSFGIYRLYNVDIPPEQTYLYEHDLYPLAKYEIQDTWKELSDIEETDYKLPAFSKIRLKVNARNTQKLATFSDKIKSIQIDKTILESDSEEKMILDCVDMIQDIDPDYIITEKGDSWDLPFLAQRAHENQVSDRLVLGREKNHPISRPKRDGTSYFSYGQIHFKPTATKLLGRIHLDMSNCTLWKDEISIQGVYEVARTCRLPIQTAARASIGKCMSSIQFYNATKRGLLIPWKPIVSEIVKNRMDLLIGDRGGLILEPLIGVHENVGEVDFASLFGNIMLKKNISAETIDCKCCPDSNNIVPDLGYHICNRKGIVPQSLKLLLDKRQKYTELIETTKDKKKLETYKERKAALKWILVTSFGYLGFNNAKFGRIDAHMAVCAFARNLLLQAIKISEKNGFKVLHGIVDSLWIHKKNATRSDYDDIRNKIAEETGFDLSLDVYNWIVFLPSKENKIVPVPNRYFGSNQNHELKLRGIETRRHDTPEFFNQCQHEILNLFASCKGVNEIKRAISEARGIQERYRERLLRHKVPLDDLVFTNRVTRGTGEHKSNTIQADAVNQLKWAGRTISPGQKIRYVINDYTRRISKRVVPIEIAGSNYDAKRYSELLDECCKSILEPFEN